MGKDYRDEAWCDNIPMDFVHDGHRNTYTFKTRKFEIVLFTRTKELLNLQKRRVVIFLLCPILI